MDKKELEAKKVQLEKQLATLTNKYGLSASKEEQQEVIEIGKKLDEVVKMLEMSK